MPRKRKAARAFRGQSGNLTSTQRQILLYGDVMFGAEGRGFQSESEARSAWRRHRAELLAEASGPGRRPRAFFTFELGADDWHWRWFDELALLLDHQQIDAKEAAALEHQHAALAESQGEIYSVFDSSDAVRRQQLGQYVLENLVRELGTFARWHLWRGRPEIAARYQRRAEVVRSLIAPAKV